MPKGIDLKRFWQANDTKVCIQVGAVVVRMNNHLIGCGMLAIPKLDVEGGALVEDGKAGCSGEHESVRDKGTCAEMETSKADADSPGEADTLPFGIFSQVDCKCRREEEENPAFFPGLSVIFSVCPEKLQQPIRTK